MNPRLAEGIKRIDGKPVDPAVIEMIIKGSGTDEPSPVQAAFDAEFENGSETKTQPT